MSLDYTCPGKVLSLSSKRQLSLTLSVRDMRLLRFGGGVRICTLDLWRRTPYQTASLYLRCDLCHVKARMDRDVHLFIGGGCICDKEQRCDRDVCSELRVPPRPRLGDGWIADTTGESIDSWSN